MDVRTFTLNASDGFELHATLYDANSDRAMIMAAAMGVKRRYYDAFARHVAESGRSVVTFDYRGMGESRPVSLRGFPATMEEWGRYDIPAVIDWIARELRPRSLAYAGHSAGGQLAGLAPNAGAVDRFLFVCSQSGYWRHWPGIRAWGLGTLWVTMPIVSRMAGILPIAPLRPRQRRSAARHRLAVGAMGTPSRLSLPRRRFRAVRAPHRADPGVQLPRRSLRAEACRRRATREVQRRTSDASAHRAARPRTFRFLPQGQGRRPLGRRLPVARKI